MSRKLDFLAKYDENLTIAQLKQAVIEEDKKFDSKKEGLLDFKYKENAEEHVLMNKPILSLNDLLSVWGSDVDIERYRESPLFKNFKDLASGKI